MLPDEPTEEERKEKLDQDYETPFRPADDTTVGPAPDDTHPNTDTGVDHDELYQEGMEAATGAPVQQDPAADLEDVSEISEEETNDTSIGSPS